MDVSDCLLATGMFCAFIRFFFSPLGLGNELGNILGVCSAERRQAYLWSPFLPRPLLLPKIFFSGFPACSPPARLLARPRAGLSQGSLHLSLYLELLWSAYYLPVCLPTTQWLPQGNSLVLLIDSPLCSFGPMLCAWGLCSEHLWFRDQQHEHHSEPVRSAASQTSPRPLESQSSI